MDAMPIPAPSFDSPSAVVLSIALIDADDQHRREVASALEGFQGTTVREYSAFPPDLEDLPRLLEQRYDAVIIGLDSDPEYAYDIVESLCASNATTVMVYTAQTQLELAVRFMRAGAREFLILPLLRADIAGALARVSIRRSAVSHGRRTSRKLFVFLGVKGGCGVTTISSNFAVALAQESGQRTLLIDFGQPLGDAALNLGMVTQYSTTNALQDSSRLDGNFFRSLLAKHSSGLAVLAAPGEFSPVETPNEAIDKLITVARQCFDYVVVDAGSRIDLRYTPHALLFDEKHIAKALTKPANWKIPDDFATARRTGNSATPVVLQDSPIARTIRQMARTACGMPATPEKKKGFSFFRSFSRPARELPEPEEG